MRPTTLKSAKERAWRAFSRYVIDRDRRCITCGSLGTPQAGHFHHNCLDFDEVNINRQCSSCNKWHHGRLDFYAQFLLRKHGLKEFNALSKRRYEALRGEKRSIEEYLEIEKKYKQKLNEISNS